MVKKKVLVTGCSGYIGSHLCKMLENDYDVYGLDINVPQVDTLVDYYNIDITRPFDLPEEFDTVIHLAALVNVGESEVNPIKYYITNINGTMNVINKINTKNFIFASTGAAEGCASAYGISKRAAEDVVREFYNVHKPTPYTIFRFYNVIGSDGFKPTNPDGLMYNLMKAEERGEFTIFGNDYDTNSNLRASLAKNLQDRGLRSNVEYDLNNDGTCVRDYVHVNEICDALRTSIEKPSNSVECLGHGVGWTVQEMVDEFKKINKCDFVVKYGPRRQGDLPVSVLANVSPYMKTLYTMYDLLKVDK